MPSTPYTAIARYPYTPEAENAGDDLSFKVGQSITVTEVVDADWLYGSYRDDNGEIQSGYFPKNFVEAKAEPVESVESVAAASAGAAEAASKTTKSETPTKTTTSLDPAPAGKTAAETKPTPTSSDDVPAPQPLPNVVEKHKEAAGSESSFCTKLKSFNTSDDSSAPLLPHQVPEQSFVRKQFAAAETRSSYVPPPIQSEPRPAKKNDGAAVARENLVSESTITQEEEGPKLTLKERMRLLQEQQEKEQEALESALKRKEERKKKKLTSTSTGGTLKSLESTKTGEKSLHGVEHVLEEEREKLKEDIEETEEALQEIGEANTSAEPVTVEPIAKDAEDELEQEAAVEGGATETTIAEDGNDNEDNDDDDDDDDDDDATDESPEDAAELKRRQLRERMAKLSGGMGMFGMMGFGGAGASAKKVAEPVAADADAEADDDSEKKTEEEDEQIRDLPQAIPVMGFAMPKTAAPPKSLSVETETPATATTADQTPVKVSAEDIPESPASAAPSAPVPPIPTSPLAAKSSSPGVKTAPPPVPTSPVLTRAAPPIPTSPLATKATAEVETSSDEESFHDGEEEIAHDQSREVNASVPSSPAVTAPPIPQTSGAPPPVPQAPPVPSSAAPVSPTAPRTAAPPVPGPTPTAPLQEEEGESSDEDDSPPPPQPVGRPAPPPVPTGIPQSPPAMTRQPPPPPPSVPAVPGVPAVPAVNRSVAPPSLPSVPPPIQSANTGPSFVTPLQGVNTTRSTTNVPTVDISAASSSGDRWWVSRKLPPPLTTADVYFETVCEQVKKRHNRCIAYVDYYTVSPDLSSKLWEISYDIDHPEKLVTFAETSYPKPHPTDDYLAACSQKYGSVAYRAAAGALNNEYEGSLVHHVYNQIPEDALPPVAGKTFGATVYRNNNNQDVRKADEIRAGDVLVIVKGKFEGHSALRKAKVHELGFNGQPYAAFVTAYDAQKEKIKVVEESEGMSRVNSFKLSEFKSGKIRVFRIVGRDCIGW